MLKKKKKMTHFEFECLFKLPVRLMDYVWKTLTKSYPDRFKPKYLLWTMYFLKTTNENFQEISTFLKTNQKTLRLHLRVVLDQLNNILPKVS
jgi:hypothetical protein